MFNLELRTYLKENNIQYKVLELASRSSKKKVLVGLLYHPIDDRLTKELRRTIHGLYTSCALTLEHLLLIPKEELGLNINLMDAIDLASTYVEGGTPSARVKEVEFKELPTPETKKEEVKPKRAPRKKAAVKRAPAAKKKVVVRKKKA